MSLFSGLYVGTSALKTSQNSLNTVAHNLSNINTEGYVRQQVATTDTIYTNSYKPQAVGYAQIGEGVVYSQCKHIRDIFLDARYREESGRESFYEVSYSATLEIEDILGELDGASFSQSLSNLWTSIEELSKSPGDSTYISLLVQSSNTFVENARAVYQSMIDYQKNLNAQIQTMVEKINSIGDQVATLNNQIAMVEAGKTEAANDLRDKRDKLIDELAEYGNIKYDEDSLGKVTIRFNDVDFVNEEKAYHIGIRTDLATGFYFPYWEQNVTYTRNEEGDRIADYSCAGVFDISEEISNDHGTDVGGLRALLVARGDHVANFTDLDISAATTQKLNSLEITVNQYDDEVGLEYFNTYINNSVMMQAEAEFDNLIHYVVTTINQVLADNADSKSGYLCNEDGSPLQIFKKSEQDAYEKVSCSSINEAKAMAEANPGKVFQIYDENGNPTTEVWKFVEEEFDFYQSLYNCKTLEINQELAQTPTILGFVTEDSSIDYKIGQDFIKAFQENELYINPNATAPTKIQDAYIELVNQVATEGNVYKSLFEYQQLAVEQADANRQAVIGVSSDEELEHMIMYQNAYNAASRYVNVLNELLDRVIALGA